MTPGIQNPSPQYDAVIFIPSIGKQWTNVAVEIVARKMVTALSVKARDKHQKFDMETRYEQINKQNHVKICTVGVSKGENQPLEPILDLYEYNYRGDMVERFEHSTLLLKVFYVFFPVFANFIRVLRYLIPPFGKRHAPQESKDCTTKDKIRVAQYGKSIPSRFQMLFILSLYLILCVYMASLVYKVVETVQVALSPAPTTETTTPPSTPDAETQQSGNEQALTQVFSTIFNGIFVVVTAMAAVSKDDVRTFLIGLTTDLVCILNYLDNGTGKNNATGNLVVFIDDIVANFGDKYKRYIIMTYGFGSIVALDALYTDSGRQPEPVINSVDMLVTIGSPFDLIRTFWPAYFVDRTVVNETHNLKRPWLNVYSPMDLLGSNFRNDASNSDPEQSYIWGKVPLPNGPKPTKNIKYEGGHGGNSSMIAVIDKLVLQELWRDHSIYWDERDVRDCFWQVVPEMYPQIAGSAMNNPVPEAAIVEP